MNRTFCTALACLLAASIAPLAATAATSPAAVGDPSHPEALQSAIDAAFSGGADTVTITPGKYILPVSRQRSTLRFTGLSNKTIVAENVELVFEDAKRDAVDFVDCTGVTFRGAVLHYRSPQTGQGTIVGAGQDKSGDYYDIDLEAGYPDNPDFQFYYVFDPATRIMKAAAWFYHAQSVVPLAQPRRVRIYTGQTGPLNPLIAVGDLAACRAPVAMMISSQNCARCTFQDLTFYWGALFGFVEKGGDGANRYLHDTITYGPIPPGATSRPLLSQSADGFHSAGVAHGPDIENCLFEGMGDDGIAIHGSYDELFQCSGNVIIIGDRSGRCNFGPNSPLRIEDDNGGKIEQAVVTAVEPAQFALPAGFQNPAGPGWKTAPALFSKITLDRPIDFPQFSLVSNPLLCGAGYRLIGNTIRNNIGRGMLLKADDGLIENNVVDGSTIADIVITPQPTWGEAGYSRNVRIVGNTLRHSNYAITGRTSGYPAALTIGTAGCIGHQDITIEGNTFDSLPVESLSVSGAQNVAIRDNTFLDPFTKPSPAGPVAIDRGFDPTAVIWIGAGKDVALSGNRVIGMGPYGKSLVVAAPTASGVTGAATGVVRVEK